jgi:hypothetical protein
MVGVTRQSPLDSSGFFNELVRKQLQSGEGMSSKITGLDRASETNTHSLLPGFPSNEVSAAPVEKMPRRPSLESPTKQLPLDKTSIRQALPETMPTGKIEETTDRMPEPPLIVAMLPRTSAASGNIRSEALATVSESSSMTAAGPRAIAAGHHSTKSARATPEASAGFPPAKDADDLRDKADGTKIDDRFGSAGTSISDAASTRNCFQLGTTRDDSKIEAPVLDSEVSVLKNPGRPASKQNHGPGSMDKTVTGKPALSAVRREKNFSAPKVASSSTATSPKENPAKVVPHAAPHLRTATESVQPAIAGEPCMGTNGLAELVPAADIFASPDTLASKTVTLPASKVNLATGKSLGAGVDLPVGQPRPARAADRTLAASLDDQKTAAKTAGIDNRPESSPRTVPVIRGATTEGRAVAHDKETGPQIPALVSSLIATKNTGPDLIGSCVLSQAQPIHPTSGTTTTQQGSPGVHSLRTPASVTFDRMDEAPAPQIIESTPQRLAVGVHDAGLGWVEIRTNSAAGQVSATVASSSAETHSAISAQLPTMHEYLASEHVHIDTLASERFSPSSGGGENSSRDQSHNGAGTQAKSMEQEISSLAFPGEMETEELSYINVRV